MTNIECRIYDFGSSEIVKFKFLVTPPPEVPRGRRHALCSAIVQRAQARSLVLIDSIETNDGKVVDAVIARLLASVPNARFLVVGNSSVRAKTIDYYIKLGPLSPRDLREAVLLHFGVVLEELTISSLFDHNSDWTRKWEERAFAALEAYPPELSRELYSRETVRAFLEHVASNWHLLRDFIRSGLLGPDGQPLVPVSEKLVIAHVRAADAALLDKVLKEKHSVYSLSPRQFEELVA